jgi:hypothetical protein
MVDTEALRAELDRLGIDPSRYSLKGGALEDGFAMKREGRRWIVYYSERGGRYDIEKFTTEDAACRWLLSRLTGTDFLRPPPRPLVRRPP